MDIEISEKPLFFFNFFKRWQITTQPRRKNRKIGDCHECEGFIYFFFRKRFISCRYLKNQNRL